MCDKWVLAPSCTGFLRHNRPPPGVGRRAIGPPGKGAVSHGELLIIDLTDIIDLVEFLLVAVLGFMPLIIIHWADRRPHVYLPHLPRWGRGAWRLAVAAKTGLLLLFVEWANWWVV